MRDVVLTFSEPACLEDWRARLAAAGIECCDAAVWQGEGRLARVACLRVHLRDGLEEIIFSAMTGIINE